MEIEPIKGSFIEIVSLVQYTINDLLKLTILCKQYIIAADASLLTMYFLLYEKIDVIIMTNRNSEFQL